MHIGRRVAQLREAHGESLREAALRTGVSHTTIARIEKGDAIGSFQSTLRKIADGYGVQVEFLLNTRDPRQEFLYAMHRLTQPERARLYFHSVKSRLRMALDFLTHEFPTEFSLDQLAVILDTTPGALHAMLESEQEEAGPREQRLAETLARLTGIPLPWITSGAIGNDQGEPAAAVNVVPFVGLMKKAAREGLPPDELEMVIDMLITRGKGARGA